MTTSSTTSTKNQTQKNKESSTGKQGFASMPKEQVKEIAREGGKHSHDNDGNKQKSEEGSSSSSSRRSSGTSSGQQKEED